MPKSSFCLASGESLEPHSASFRLLAQVRVSVMLSRLKMVEKSLVRNEPPRNNDGFHPDLVLPPGNYWPSSHLSLK